MHCLKRFKGLIFMAGGGLFPTAGSTTIAITITIASHQETSP